MNNKVNSLTEEEKQELEKQGFVKNRVDNSDIIEYRKGNVSFLFNDL